MFAIEDGPPPPASPSFTCHLTIPALSIPHGGYEETSFTAVARSKKAAEHAAAEKALGFIAAQGLLPQPTPAPVPVQGLNVSVDEVRLLQQRLRTLSCQLAATKAAATDAVVDIVPGDALELASAPSVVSTASEPDIDVSSLGEEELRKELIKAHEANVRLRKELQLEQQRRQIAVGALVGNP